MHNSCRAILKKSNVAFLKVVHNVRARDIEEVESRILFMGRTGLSNQIN